MTWTVEELLERAQELIEEFGQTGDSKRVRWEPNQRLVRYYTTLGLVDKPLGRRGQVVHYGPRHLLQLLAVKQMQAQGMTLQQIQARLLGLPEGLLEEIAGLPEVWRARVGVPVEPAPPAPPAMRFWERRAAPYDSVPIDSVVKVELPGVTLLIDDPKIDPVKLSRAVQAYLKGEKA